MCGSKATGETRGIVGVQPFCFECYEEAKVEVAKPKDEWSNKLLEARLINLRALRNNVLEQRNKSTNMGKLDVFVNVFGNQTRNINTNIIRGQTYQVLSNAIESHNKEIASLEQILIRRREPTPKLPQANQNPVTILKIRFAKGEITKDEYEEMLNILTSS